MFEKTLDNIYFDIMNIVKPIIVTKVQQSEL